MEERERMETVPMGNGSKEELFEKGHPVIRELKSIPEIIFEEQIGMLPSSAIPVKSLFARKQMDHFHVDSLILKKIALQVLHILKKLSQKHIYPGLIELQEFYVDMDNSQYGVVLLHPEKFQLLTFEQDYEWYPEDERIFGDATLFDEKMQQIADNRLIYKILVASAKGNVKIPPLKTEADYSELFYNILSEEWKQIFENREICSYEKLQNLLEESIQIKGIPLNIIDTAGIRDTNDLIEKIGVDKAKDLLTKADLVLYVVDTSDPLTKDDEEIMELIEDKQTIVLLNKADLDQVVKVSDLKEKGFEQIVQISAKEQTGIEELYQLIQDIFFEGHVSFNDEIYLTNMRHKTEVSEALKSLAMVLQSIEDGMPEDFFSIDLLDAYEHLGFITGESVGEDLVNEIFAEFCMGK